MAQGSIEPQQVPDPTPSAPGSDPRFVQEDSRMVETNGLISQDDGQASGNVYTNYGTSSRADVGSETKHYRGIDRKHFWWLFSGIIFGDLIAFFDATFMASSHPVITSYFHVSNSASWLSTVFYLTSTVFQPLYGRISDTVGRRSVYLFAISTFFVATAWCAFAQDIGSFIIARAFCGLGAGGVISMGFIIISDVVKIEYRGVYQSYVNLAYGFGNGAGAALGGLLCDHLGWRAAFGLQLPLIFAYLVLAFFTTPKDLGPMLAKVEAKTIRQALRSFDIKGSICLTTSVSCLILGLNLGGNILAWSHPVVIISLIVSLVLSIVLVRVEGHAKRPILPLRLLSTVPFANLMYSNFFCLMVVNTVLFNVPLFLQAVRQFTPTTSGLYLTSPLAFVTLASVFTGFFITWSRRMKPTLVAGALLTLGGGLATACLWADMPSWTILALIPWANLGQGFLGPSTTLAVLSLSSQEDQAVVTTTLGLFRNLGSIMGVAISSWILQNTLVIFLSQKVTGPAREREQIILRVRKSIQEIGKLDSLHKSQVIEAYGQALRVTFLSGVVFAFLVVVLIVPIRVPRLKQTPGRRASQGRIG